MGLMTHDMTKSAARLAGLPALAGVIAFCGGCSGVHWRLGLDAAVSKAAREDRLVLVYYWQPFNADCGRMDRTVFRSEEVLAQMQGMIPVKLDATFHGKRGEQLGLREVPSFLVVGPDGAILRRGRGVMDVDQFLAFLVMAGLSR